MDDKILKYSYKFGWIYQESIHFNDMDFLQKNKTYKLSRIKVWIGKKQNQVVIQGIQSFFRDMSGNESSLGEFRNMKEHFDSTHEIVLDRNEYIIDFHIRFDTEVTEIGFTTNKGQTQRWGGTDGEEKITHLTGADKIIVGLFGSYTNYLGSCGVIYIDKKDFIRLAFLGFFKMRYLIKKDETFKKKCESRTDLEEPYKILLKVCNLPNVVFNQVMKYCFN